jgi:hypothetical protein
MRAAALIRRARADRRADCDHGRSRASSDADPSAAERHCTGLPGDRDAARCRAQGAYHARGRPPRRDARDSERPIGPACRGPSRQICQAARLGRAADQDHRRSRASARAPAQGRSANRHRDHHRRRAPRQSSTDRSPAANAGFPRLAPHAPVAPQPTPAPTPAALARAQGPLPSPSPARVDDRGATAGRAAAAPVSVSGSAGRVATDGPPGRILPRGALARPPGALRACDLALISSAPLARLRCTHPINGWPHRELSHPPAKVALR